MPVPISSSRLAFGLFELDLDTGELWKAGYRVRLQSQPFRILAILLERPGQIISRKELHTRVWGPDTNVDYDHAIGTAINKIREALGDSSDNPRFVETLARRGYRFIAPVHHAHIEISQTTASQLTASQLTVSEIAVAKIGLPRIEATQTEKPRWEAPQADAPTSRLTIVPSVAENMSTIEPEIPAQARRQEILPSPIGPRTNALPAVLPAAEAERFTTAAHPIGRRLRPTRLGLAAAFGLLLALTAGVAFRLGRLRAEVRPAHIVQVTHNGHLVPSVITAETLASMVTDGTHIFTRVSDRGRVELAEIALPEGTVSGLSMPEEVASPALGDVSPDGSRLLLRDHLSPESEQPLWIVPSRGGSALRVGNVLAHDATWMPGGQTVLYATGNQLMLAGLNGGGPERYATLPGRAFWLRWSPDGALLRFTLIDPLDHTLTLWQLNPGDRTPKRLLRGFHEPASECCGVWTADGRAFVFQSSRAGNTDLWRLSGISTGGAERVTDGPLQFEAPVPARTGSLLYFLGADTRSELERLTATGELTPEHGFLANAMRVEFTRDGRFVAWTDIAGHLWRARADGSGQIQLTPDSLDVFLAHWSPDGSRLALMARSPGRAWAVYLVAADGDGLRMVSSDARNAADPSWSPDGATLVFGRTNDAMGQESARTLEYLDLRTGAMRPVPGSEGLFSPRWSPDGRFIVALSLDQRTVKLLEVATGRWRTLQVSSGADPVWAPDSRSLFVHASLSPQQLIDRIAVPDGHVEEIAHLARSEGLNAVSFVLSGLDADGAPLIRTQMYTSDLYSVDLAGR